MFKVKETIKVLHMGGFCSTKSPLNVKAFTTQDWSIDFKLYAGLLGRRICMPGPGCCPPQWRQSQVGFSIWNDLSNISGQFVNSPRHPTNLGATHCLKTSMLKLAFSAGLMPDNIMLSIITVDWLKFEQQLIWEVAQNWWRRLRKEDLGSLSAKTFIGSRRIEFKKFVK